MSVLSGYGKYKRYVLTSNGYKLCSQWTNSNTVHFDDGNTAQTKVGAINGITDSLTSTSSNVALSAKAGKNLQDQVTELNTGIDGFTNKTYDWKNSSHAKLSDDIFNHWTEIGISPSYGNIFIRNGTYYYCGVYIKYNNYNGSILLIDSMGNMYIWKIVSGVHSMKTIAF